MNKEDASFRNFIEIIDSMAKIQEWEEKNLPLLNSLTGRSLYYKIARISLSGENEKFNTMKGLAAGSDFTEKSLRNRINLMEKDGFVASAQSGVDGRSRYPSPKDKFYDLMLMHASQIKKILGNDFLIIRK